MDLDLLKTFLEVVKTRHFGRAADSLCLTQSAVSARIRHLEEQVGVKLFERTTKNVHLTPEGERFITHAEMILLAWSTACFEMNPAVDHKELITIASTPSLWHYFFVQGLLPVCQQQRYMVNALSYSSEDLSRLVFNEAVDLILSYDAVHETGISQLAVGNLQLNLYTTRANSVAPDITSTPYVHVDWGAAFNLFISKNFGDNLSLAMQTNNAQVAEKVIEQMDGMAYLPSSVAAMNDQLVAIQGKKIPTFKRKIFASYSINSVKTAELKALIKTLMV